VKFSPAVGTEEVPEEAGGELRLYGKVLDRAGNGKGKEKNRKSVGN